MIQTSSFIDVLRRQANKSPDLVGYTFLTGEDLLEAKLTYAELDKAARLIAAHLQEKLQSGNRVLLLYAPGLEYISAFFGCIYAGIIAVPIYPPDPTRLDQDLSRFQAILQDADPAAILTTSPIFSLVSSVMSMYGPVFEDINWITTDDLDPSAISAWKEPLANENTVAFLQYTSGSIAKPKGVMLSHGNLLHNSQLIKHGFEATHKSRGVIWLPPYHDMGLIGGILQPLYIGFSVYLMSPLDFLKNPIQWLRAITRYRGTISGGPNFAYDLCVRKIKPVQREELDLSCWEVAFNGAEPIRVETLTRFIKAFAPQGFRRKAFYPCYGLAEGTLIASGGSKAQSFIEKHVDKQSLQVERRVSPPRDVSHGCTVIGCGAALRDQQIEIVDPDSRQICPPGQVGEIWLAGESVAKGYWRNEQATASFFQAYTAEPEQGPFLRTGDLGFIENGELFVTGRIKDLIIIRGRNIHPHDLEQTAEECHTALRKGCVVAFSTETTPLVIVQELSKHNTALEQSDYDAIVTKIRRTISIQHQLHVDTVILTPPRVIPKTSSGKVRRHACRHAFEAGQLSIVFQSTWILERSILPFSVFGGQEGLIRFIQQHISHPLGIPADQVEISRPLNDFGLDSVMLVDLNNALKEYCGQPIPVEWLLSNPTVSKLAERIHQASFGKTVHELIQKQVDTNASAIALIAPDRSPLTYGELYVQMEEIGQELNSMGIGRNDPVAIVLPNGPEIAAAFLAVASVATSAPLNPAYREQEFKFYLSDLKAKALILQKGKDSPAIAVARELAIPIILLEPLLDEGAGRFRLEASKSRLVSQQMGWAQTADVALVLHTSGTTSRPKMVPLTHTNLCTSADNIRRTLQLTSDDSCLNVMPLFHIHGLMAAILSSLTAGATVVCTPGFYAPQFYVWMTEFLPTWFTAVPTMHQAILARAKDNQAAIEKAPLRFIRSSSSSLPPQVMKDLQETFAVPVIEAYGMTEASHQMTSNPLPFGRQKVGSVGLPTNIEVAIMNDIGELLSPHTVGEIVIRGASVMNGYAQNPQANAAAFTDGWFRTGDQGYYDEDNYFFITGRRKEIINRAGEKISPREVDEVLLAHPQIIQALTFAFPHHTLGEDVAAAVILKPDTSVTEIDIREFVAQHLVHFKVPSRIIFMDEIPKGPTGKLQRIGFAERIGMTTAKTKSSASYIAPRTPAEEKVASIWADVLGLEKVGIQDDFLQLGGDSLLATKIVSRILDTFQIKLSLIRLFESPNVADQVVAITEAQADRIDPDELSHLLAQLENLPDGEIKKMLAD